MLKTADICDRQLETLQVCQPGFHHFTAKSKFCGIIQTVCVFENNTLIREVLSKQSTGQVLVIDGGASLNCALFGDQMAALAIENKFNGIIINGCVRDSAELSNLPIGVIALATHPLRCGRQRQGDVNKAVDFWGVNWCSGEYVYADDDGIVLSKHEILA